MMRTVHKTLLNSFPDWKNKPLLRQPLHILYSWLHVRPTNSKMILKRLLPDKSHPGRCKTSSIGQSAGGLTHIAIVEPLIVLTFPLSRCFSRKQQDKVQKAVARGQVGSDYGWLVILLRPGRSGEDEPGLEAIRNHKRRSLNTRLSSGTSANTSCRSRNAPGSMIRSDLFWYGNNLKMKPTYGEKNLLDIFFWRVQVHP